MEFVNFQVCDFLGFVFLGLKYHYLGHICRYTEVIEITVYAAGVDYCPVVCSDDLNTGLRPREIFLCGVDVVDSVEFRSLRQQRCNTAK